MHNQLSAQGFNVYFVLLDKCTDILMCVCVCMHVCDREEREFSAMIMFVLGLLYWA